MTKIECATAIREFAIERDIYFNSSSLMKIDANTLKNLMALLNIKEEDAEELDLTELSIRSENGLKNCGGGVVSRRMLQNLYEVQILRTPNMGRKSLDEIVKWADRVHGIKIKKGRYP